MRLAACRARQDLRSLGLAPKVRPRAREACEAFETREAAYLAAVRLPSIGTSASEPLGRGVGVGSRAGKEPASSEERLTGALALKGSSV